MDTETFLKKRIFKILIPWIIWCILWLDYGVVVSRSIHITSVRELVVTLYNGIFNNELQSIYWFFIPMIMVCFSMPVLSCLANNRKLLWYIVGITFITYSLLPELCVIVGVSYNGSLYFQVGWGYFYTLYWGAFYPRLTHATELGISYMLWG